MRSHATPCGYRGPKAIRDAIGYAKFYSRSHDAVIRVYDAAGNEIETHQHAGEFKSGELLLSSHRSSAKPGTGHWLLVAYTVYFNRRHRWSGHLFQGRYKSFLVQEGDYLLGLSRYVHLNPVRGVSLGRGTPSERRKRLRAFRWSSYRGYAGLSAPFPFVQETMVLDELRGPRRAERLRYRRFVEKGLLREVDNPFEAVQWQAVLGDESFVQKLRDRVKGLHKQRREITSLRKAAASIDPDRILQRVAEKYQVDRERLVARGGRSLHARNVAMWMIWETGNKSLREIGELFGGLDYATVAQRIRRTRSSHDSIAARKLKATMFDPDASLPTLRTRPRARVSHSRPQLYQIGCEAEGLSQQLKVTPQQGHP